MPAKKHIDVERLIKASTDGLTSGEICERFGINQATLYYHLKKRGLWHGKQRKKTQCQIKREALMKASAPKVLVCHKCRRNSIPAPEGSTAKTRYICKECSPLAIDYSACVTGELASLSSLPWVWQGDAARGVKPEDVLGKFTQNIDEIISRPSSKILRARKAGHAWAINATPARLARLAPALRKSFVMAWWAGLKDHEIADLLEIRRDQVRKNICEAKKILAHK